MAIASIDDVKRCLDAVPPSGKARIEIAADGQITEAGATTFLDGQEAYILAKLGYTPDVTNKLLIEIHAKLTAFHIWIHIVQLSHGEGEIPEYVWEWKNWAEKCLEDAKSGDLDIPAATSDVTPLRAFSSDMRQVVDEPVTMKINDWVKLKFYPMISNSEIVWSDKDKAGTEYVKDTDYKINYQQNEVMAINGGAITDEQKVYFSYQHIESKVIHKDPERVDYADRGALPNWSGLFGG